MHEVLPSAAGALGSILERRCGGDKCLPGVTEAATILDGYLAFPYCESETATSVAHWMDETMKPKRPGGNGASKIDIHSADLGGWLRVYPSRYHDLPDDLAVFLAITLTNWFRQHPQCHLRTVAPITKDGTTVELHAWFDVHVFPPPPPPQTKA
jgi:hypothetical protein